MENEKTTPPKHLKRDDRGLLSSIEYVYNNEGLIDWRKMIKPEFFVANRQNFERRNKPVPDNIDGLEDKDLLILLGGIKELAQIRGFRSETYTFQAPSPDYVIACCTLIWVPNYENEMVEVTSSAIGDASPNNTTNFARNYLGPMAQNRAFVRCVRNFLKINVVAQEEIGGAKAVNEELVSNEFNPKALLSKIMKDKGVTFPSIKAKLEKEKFENAESFSSIQDIPNIKVFELIERLQKVKI